MGSDLVTSALDGEADFPENRRRIQTCEAVLPEDFRARRTEEMNVSDPLTHFDENGASRMVDIGDKRVTARTAVASGTVKMQPATLKTIRDRSASKGDVLEVARLAGIMATKQTAHLIPLCHSLAVDTVQIGFDFPDETSVRIRSTVAVTAKTGVEMEALTSVTVAALTIYDMCKAIDRGMEIIAVRLDQKSGGRSGDYLRDDQGNEN